MKAPLVSVQTAEALLRHGISLSNNALRMPMFLRAGSGSGKSRWLGRVLIWTCLLWGAPAVVYDPHGQAVANFIDKLIRLPYHLYNWGVSLPEIERTMKALVARIRYVDMSGVFGRVYHFPGLYRLGQESLYEIAQRPIEVFLKTDPALFAASIEGANALKAVATAVGVVLAALGEPYTKAEAVIREPLVWAFRAEKLRETYPEELPPAIAYLKTLAELEPSRHQRITASFYTKVYPLVFEPTLKAMFGADKPSLDWQQVEKERLIVLLDFSRVHDLERRLFLLRWSLEYLLNYVKHRGPGRHQSIGLIFDELAALFPPDAHAADVLSYDLDALINQFARNYSLYPFCLATQELYQFPERLQKTLLTMGTQIHGSTSDPEAAVTLARKFARYQPYALKERIPMYSSFLGAPMIVDYHNLYFTPEEQLIKASYQFLDLRKFEFLVRLPQGEGDISNNLRRISIAGLDRGQFPREDLILAAQQRQMEQYGVPILERGGQQQESLSGSSTDTLTTADLGDIPLYEPIGDGTAIKPWNVLG